MRRLVLICIQWLYIHLAKPLLFFIAPDDAHVAMINFSKTLGRTALGRGFVRLFFKTRSKTELKQTIVNQEFTRPVGLAAGFDKNGEIVPVVSALGFGFEVVGSVTARRCEGNPHPWFYRLPNSRGAVVNAGLANYGSRDVINHLQALIPKKIDNLPIVLSVAKTNNKANKNEIAAINDYLTTLNYVKDIKNIKMIELNISCPNSFGGEDFASALPLDHLLSSVDALNMNLPIFIKMPIDLPWSEFQKLLNIIIKHQIAGVVISNLTKDRSGVAKEDNLTTNIRGNISGKPTWDKSNELISKTYQKYGKKLAIVGVGGIFSAEDAYQKIRLGASLVQIITGMFFVGPQLPAQINIDLIRLMKKDGFTNIKQAVGVDSKAKI